MSAWFRYERDFAQRFCPVVIYGDEPRIPRGEEDRYTKAVAVPVDCLSTDGSPMFGRLQAIYPAPAPKEES